jgi:type IV pilus assembly protein PilN
MRITINLATHPFVDIEPRIKLLRTVFGSLSLIAVGLGLCMIFIHQKAEKARTLDRSLDSQIAGINQERQGYQIIMHKSENAQLMNQIGDLNQILDEKAFSWTVAMEDLETVLPGGVQVTSLEPARDKNGDTTLHLRVTGPRDRTLDLVRNLEKSRHFLLPRIVGENFENNGGPSDKLEPVSASNRFSFDLLAEYNPAALAEPTRPKKELEQKPQNTGEPSSEVKGSQPQIPESNVLASANHPSATSPTRGRTLNVNAKKSIPRPNDGGR